MTRACRSGVDPNEIRRRGCTKPQKDADEVADSGGWGWAMFDYDAASDTFTPGTLVYHPPQGNDAKCGFACHTSVKARDYVFTDYQHR